MGTESGKTACAEVDSFPPCKLEEEEEGNGHQRRAQGGEDGRIAKDQGEEIEPLEASMEKAESTEHVPGMPCGFRRPIAKQTVPKRMKESP